MRQSDKKEPGVFYLIIHSKLERISKGDLPIKVCQVEEILRNMHRIPGKYGFSIIKEMEQMGLVKIIDRLNVKIVPGKSRNVENISAINRMVGCF